MLALQLNPRSYALVALCTLAFVLGVVQIALQVSVKNELAGNGNTGTYWPQDGSNPARNLKYVPAHLITSVADAIIASGALAVFIGAFGCLYALLENDHPATLKPLLHCALQAVVSLAVLILLIACWVKHYSSATWFYSGYNSGEGSFSHESWVCQMRHESRSEASGWLWKSCSLAVGARALTVPLSLLLLAIASMSVVDLKRPTASATAIAMEDLRLAEKPEHL